MRPFALVLALAGLAPAALATRPGVLRPSPAEPETWGETFTAVANLEEGSYILLQLVFSNAGIGDRKGSCRLLWLGKGQAPVHSTQHVEERGWQYEGPSASSPDERLRVGTCTLAVSGGHTRFEATLEDTRVELWAEAAPRRGTTTERVAQAQGFYEGEVLIPWAQARARLSRGASPARELRGVVSLDHTRATLLIPKVASAWFRFRGASRAAPLVIHVRLAPDGALAPSFVWPQGQARPTPVAHADAAPEGSGEGQAALPRLRLRLEGGGEGEVRALESLFAFEPTRSFGLLGTLARPFVGNPITRTYRAEWRQGEQVIPGTLEWSRIGDR